jgi:hypothetical protein
LLPTIKQREEFAQTGIDLLLDTRTDGAGEMKRMPQIHLAP